MFLEGLEQRLAMAADPIAVDDYITVNKNGAVTFSYSQLLSNDIAPDNGALHSLMKLPDGKPLHGRLISHPDYTVTYLPDEGFVGQDSFLYYAIGSPNNTISPAPATVHFNINSPVVPAGNETGQMVLGFDKLTVGGSSAGMHLLGDKIYTGPRYWSSVSSEEALKDPFDSSISFVDQFVDIPMFNGMIFDTHFHHYNAKADRDRFGRSTTFLGRLGTGGTYRAIAADEDAAIVISRNTGVGKVYGSADSSSIYFMTYTKSVTDIISPSTPLTLANIKVKTVKVGDSPSDEPTEFVVNEDANWLDDPVLSVTVTNGSVSAKPY